MAGHTLSMLKLLMRNEEVGSLIKFFRGLEEGFTADFADAAARMPARPRDRPAVYARGAIRRCLMDRTFHRAATEAEKVPETGFTDPPSWSYPTIRVGAFSLTLGLVERRRATGPRRLRNKGKYVRRHAKNNEVANPQGTLFRDEANKVPRMIPGGSLGALVVAESSVHAPDVPLWIGFWLPSPNLKQAYFRCSITKLLSLLQEHQRAVAGRRLRPAAGQRIERKKPTLKLKRKPREE
jgi:hypothetical protein